MIEEVTSKMMVRMLAANAVCSRLLMALVMVLGLAIPAALVGPLASRAADLVVAQDDDDDEDRNRGHGNDDDGADEDNPGRGPQRDDDDRPGRGRGPGREDARGQEQVAPAASFVIEIACPYDPAADRTTCTFAGQDANAGLREIGVPADAVCAEVLGGDYELGSFPGGPANLSEGYSSRPGRVELVLILAGEVPLGVSATYWVATAGRTFPAEGPSLGCAAEPTPLDAAATATLETEAETLGVIEVQALSCGEAQPVDPASFDWYGRCQEPQAGAAFELSRLDADDLSAIGEAEVDDEGVVRFTGLEPGTYTLDETNGRWCHAESDQVNERGEVVVEAGARVTVWTFHCGEVAK